MSSPGWLDLVAYWYALCVQTIDILLINLEVISKMSKMLLAKNAPLVYGGGIPSQRNKLARNPRCVAVKAVLEDVEKAVLSDATPSAQGVTLRGNRPPKEASHKATLLIKCKDSKGVVASLAQLLYGLGCNILQSDQFCDDGMFFQRIEVDYSDLIVGIGNTAILEKGIAEVARRFDMDWKISYNNVKRTALLVSKLDHCLYDLLIRRESGEIDCFDIPIIVSNHPDLETVAQKFGVPFKHLPITTKDEASKKTQEGHLEAVLADHGIDLIVLARYMQIFSPEFCALHFDHIINIHHSFLPAFEGGRPYHRAHERGVKIIGATAHYATSELDCGPIIAQDVTRISHRDKVDDLIRKGRDLERLVLARAVRWHCQDRVLVHANRTVVFDD